MIDLKADFDRRRGVGERTALYRLYDATDVLLYVGITKNTARRWHQHSQTKPWWRQVARREVEWLDDRPAALLAERRTIVIEHPAHNPLPAGWEHMTAALAVAPWYQHVLNDSKENDRA